MTQDTNTQGQVPEALQEFEVRKLAAIGPVHTSSGLVERRPIEYRRELEDQFVRGYRAAEKRLHAQVAALATAPDTTPTSGAADLPEALIGAIMAAAYDFRDAHISGSKNLKRTAHAELESTVRNTLHALAAGQATAAPAQPAAQQGVAYAALPEPLEIDWPELHSQALGCGVEDRGLHNRYECAEYGWQDGVDKCAERVPEQIFDADQMRAFADATCALRASRGQAPVLWLSPEQFANFVDADEAQFGRYVPARKTSVGNFTMPLFAALTPAQPAAQQVAAYATLPENYYLARGEVPTWDAKRMHAFADATHALRASHGQAPAAVPDDFLSHKLAWREAIAQCGLAVSADDPDRSYLEHELRAFDRAYSELASITPQADSVQEDAARYRWLRRWKGQEHEPPFTVQHEIDGTLWGGDLDAAIDTARKQGASHDR